MVAGAERRLGVGLPSEYLALLRIQNGGYTHGFGFPMSQRTSWATDHVPLDALNGIGGPDAELGTHNILDRDYMTEEWGLPPHQVLLTGDGHWWITLDYRNGPSPTVQWLDVEIGEEVVVADSFATLLAGLRPSSDFDTSV
ncbi:MAG: SMI1/KNR4 family protein [Bryobacteraceae bacterium]|nr:SMI1/KNR4 family protein [Bryobacteraceae bacterium]